MNSENKLKHFREKKKLTQKELAKILGVTHDYVSLIERGERKPGFKLAKEMADLFSININELSFY